MLVVLAGLAWGSLLALGFAWRLARDGLDAAVASAVPGPDQIWSWVNLGCGLLALIAWLFVAATALGAPSRMRIGGRGRRPHRDS